MEGAATRKIWFAALAAAGMATGCTGSSWPRLPGFAANSAPNTIGVVAAEQKPTWTQRITAPFKKNPFAGLGAKKRNAQQASVPSAEVSFDPKSATPELYVGLAQMSHRGGNVPKAREFYQKALAIEPNHLEALLGAARMEDREGRFDVAQMLYQRAVAAHPQSATAQNDLALCLARRDDLAGARRALEQAIGLEPSKSLYRNNVAKVFVELNQLDAAAAHLAAVHSPAAVQYNMAVLLSERGRNGEAVEFLTTALAIDPNMQPARAMLAGMTPPPTMAPVVAGQMAQVAAPVSAAPAQPVMADGGDSILPTPEAVATVPWKPPISVDAIVQQGPAAVGKPTQNAAPTMTQPSPGTQPPVLLPPVN
jgi:tetratricopeptide (TPR) repeat protein